MSKQSIPWVHVVARPDITRGRAAVYRLLAILAALVTGGLIFLLWGLNPVEVYVTMVKGSLFTQTAFRETVKIAIPLCITSLGVTLAFKMKFWNIGGEGQIAVGAIAASWIAYTYQGLPQAVMIPLMMLVGTIAGGLYGLIPAYFKTRFGTNETLFTLMLNYIATFVIQYLCAAPWVDPKTPGMQQAAKFVKAARMPTVGGISIGWIIALVLVVMVYFYLSHTKQGYELTVVGENRQTAEYAGMPVKRIILRTMFLSAALCGLAGVLKVSGTDKWLTTEVSGGIGFTAITVSWLSQLSAPAILLVSFLFSVMDKGFSQISTTFGLSPAMADVVQGIILLFVLGGEFFLRYRVVFRTRKQAKEAVV